MTTDAIHKYIRAYLLEALGGVMTADEIVHKVTGKWQEKYEAGYVPVFDVMVAMCEAGELFCFLNKNGQKVFSLHRSVTVPVFTSKADFKSEAYYLDNLP
jgi:hypothetical protein